MLGAGRGLGVGQQKGEPRERTDVIGVASVGGRLVAQAAAVLHAGGNIGQRREDSIRILGGKGDPGRRGAGLGQQGVALRRARERQVALDVEVLAVMAWGVQLARVRPRPVGL